MAVPYPLFFDCCSLPFPQQTYYVQVPFLMSTGRRHSGVLELNGDLWVNATGHFFLVLINPACRGKKCSADSVGLDVRLFLISARSGYP